MSLEDMSAVYELVRFARENSLYYRQHYETLPEHFSELQQIPMVDHTTFWEANTGLPPKNTVLTSSSIDGAVFRTGGTTAIPKASFVTRDELREGAQTWIDCLVLAGVRPDDRIANLLYGGDLYKGFLDLSLALMDAHIPNFHLSIGVSPLDSQAWTIRTFSATVLVAMPTIMCRLAEYLLEQNEPSHSVRLILYIGELLHKNQKALLKRAFPSARIGPVQYGSVDGGFIGRPDSLPNDNDEVATTYTLNSSTMIMELVTDEGQVITENGIRGNVVITNLLRRLMPVIRYPMGDMAEWMDYSLRKFRLCGRGMVAVRLGPTSYELTILKTVVSNVMEKGSYNGFQTIIKRKHGLDQMVFRIASQPKDPERLARLLEEELGRIKTDWAQEVRDGFYGPLAVEWVSVQGLIIQSRTGKLREIVDLRVD